jgi:hypothetical protein
MEPDMPATQKSKRGRFKPRQLRSFQRVEGNLSHLQNLPQQEPTSQKPNHIQETLKHRKRMPKQPVDLEWFQTSLVPNPEAPLRFRSQ